MEGFMNGSWLKPYWDIQAMCHKKKKIFKLTLSQLSNEDIQMTVECLKVVMEEKNTPLVMGVEKEIKR